MRFQIDFGLDNEAFHSDHPAQFDAYAIANVLAEIGGKIRRESALLHGETGPVYDINGNRIGEWRVALTASEG